MIIVPISEQAKEILNQPIPVMMHTRPRLIPMNIRLAYTWIGVLGRYTHILSDLGIETTFGGVSPDEEILYQHPDCDLGKVNELGLGYLIWFCPDTIRIKEDFYIGPPRDNYESSFVMQHIHHYT